MSISHPIPEIQHFQNLTLKIQGQGHNSIHKVGITPYQLVSLSFHVDRPSPITEIQLSQNLTLKIQGQGHGWDQSWKSQHMDPTFSWLASLSFHVNRASHSWVTTFSKFDLENQGSRSCMNEVTVQRHNIGLTSYQLTSLSFRVNRSKIWPCKSRVKVKWPWCCTTTGLDNSIELRMV